MSKKLIIKKSLILFSITFFSMAQASEKYEIYTSNVGFSEPKEIIDITSRINGFLKNWNYDKGNTISKNDIIASIESDKNDSSIRAIQKEIDVAEKDLASKEKLLTKNYASELDVLEAISTLETLKDSLDRAIYLDDNKVIKSPINGVLRAKDIEEGESVSSGTIVGQIYNPKSVDLYSNIYNFDKICKEKCKVIIDYNEKEYGPYEIDYKIKDLELGFDMTKVGVLLDESPIPYGVTLDFKIINGKEL